MVLVENTDTNVTDSVVHVVDWTWFPIVAADVWWRWMLMQILVLSIFFKLIDSMLNGRVVCIEDWYWDCEANDKGPTENHEHSDLVNVSARFKTLVTNVSEWSYSIYALENSWDEN